MRGERLFRILGLVDGDLIEEAAAPVKKRFGRRQAAALAACVTLLCGLSLAWLVTGGFHGMGSSASPGEGSSISGGAGNDAGARFMSYAGPVLPLTILEPDTGLTAERSVTWDFAPGSDADGAPRQWGAEVTDAYTLGNPTGEDVTATALYPFIGSLAELSALMPEVTVDGAAAETALYAGPYAGGFFGVYGENGPDGSTWNLAHPAAWTDYEALLESGDYQSQALAAAPALDQAVTVYEFTDSSAPEAYEAATQAVSFTIDRDRTAVLTYGFNGMEWDEDGGFRRYSYFVPNGRRPEPDVKLLAVLGDDIGDYALQGYQNGDCSPGNELSGVSCTVTRSVTTLDALVQRVCRAYLAQYGGKTAVTQQDSMDLLSPALFQNAVADLLSRYGLLSDTPTDRYSDGRLDDLVGEALSMDRVLYLRFDVTVPAGGRAEASARLWKAPSFDFGGSGSENIGVQGFDLVTHSGSSLDFTGLSAAMENAEGVELVRQNLGLAPGPSVELDLAQPHYYLEVRPLEGP